MGILMLKIRWSYHEHGIPILVRWHLYIETVPWRQSHWGELRHLWKVEFWPFFLPIWALSGTVPQLNCQFDARKLQWHRMLSFQKSIHLTTHWIIPNWYLPVTHIPADKFGIFSSVYLYFNRYFYLMLHCDCSIGKDILYNCILLLSH